MDSEYKLNTKGVILHGGQGSSLRPLKHASSNEVINMAEKPISQSHEN